MRVAVCIVDYRSPADIVQCLEALALSTHALFDVVVSENGGEAAYEALAACAPRMLPGGQTVRLVDAGANLGFAGGVNLCMAHAPDADAWWVLNPDTLPEPGALAAMVARLERGDCEAVGGPVLFTTGGVQSFGGMWQSWAARAVSIGYGAPADTARDPAVIEARQNYLNGASMLVSRRFVQAAGLMREDYFLYCEEVEWCLRGLACGMRLGFAADGVVLHHQGASTGHQGGPRTRSRLSVYLNERNRLLLTRDRFPARLPVVAILALAVMVQRYGRARAWRQLGYAFEGWRAGLRDERGPLTALQGDGARS